jgi:hypothetical protein
MVFGSIYRASERSLTETYPAIMADGNKEQAGKTVGSIGARQKSTSVTIAELVLVRGFRELADVRRSLWGHRFSYCSD